MSDDDSPNPAVAASNGGSNITSAAILLPPSVLVEPVASIVAPFIFAIVFFVGLVGNSLQLLTVVANRAVRRSPPNVLIACLGAADLVLLLVCVPFAATVYTLPRWPFGRVVCKLTASVQTLSVAVSVLTLTALSGDRYVAIVHPLTALRSSSLRRTLIVVTAVWMLSVAVAVPDFLAADVRPPQPCDVDPAMAATLSACNGTSPPAVVTYCDAHPPDWGSWYPQFRATLLLVFLFIVPLSAIAAFYCGVARVLMRENGGPVRNAERPPAPRPLGPPPNGRGTQQLSLGIAAMLERQEKDRKRVAKVVLSFVVVFIVCWLPRHAYLMCFYWMDFYFDVYWHAFKIIGFSLTFVYSCINPLALYLFSDEFRRYFDHYLFGCCCESKRLRKRRDTTTAITYDTNRKRASASIGSTPNNLSMENLAR